jgi:hypothetical protein
MNNFKLELGIHIFNGISLNYDKKVITQRTTEKTQRTTEELIIERSWNLELDRIIGISLNYEKKFITRRTTEKTQRTTEKTRRTTEEFGAKFIFAISPFRDFAILLYSVTPKRMITSNILLLR